MSLALFTTTPAQAKAHAKLRAAPGFDDRPCRTEWYLFEPRDGERRDDWWRDRGRLAPALCQQKCPVYRECRDWLDTGPHVYGVVAGQVRVPKDGGRAA